MAAFALASWPAHGQAPVIQPPTASEPAAAPLVEHLKVENGLIFAKRGAAWVDSGSATMGNAVKVLRDLYPEATFALDPRVADVPVADLIVRANDPMTDLAALCTACGGRYGFHAEAHALYVLQHNNSTDLKSPPTEDRGIECFNLTGYLQREKAHVRNEANHNNGPGATSDAAEVEASKRTAEAVARLQEIIQKSIVDFDPSLGQPHFQFYADAQMLIVIGSPRAIEVAAKVIHALPGQQTFLGNGLGNGDYFNLQRNAQEMQANAAARKAGLLWFQGAAPPAQEDNSNNPK